MFVDLFLEGYNQSVWGMVGINSSFVMQFCHFLRQGVVDLVVVGESSALTRNH